MGVFEKHKLLFSFQMTSMILDGDHDLDKKEFDFYMKGNPSLDRPKEPSPHAWLSETGWKDQVDEVGTWHSWSVDEWGDGHQSSIQDSHY